MYKEKQMSNYIGYTPEQIFAALPNRYFYGLRRTDEGELFVSKVDLSKKDSSININNPGETNENYTNFQQGQDFYEGRDVNHNTVYDNLAYEQYKWDDTNIYYYVNSEGELVASINQTVTYDENSSSNG